MRQADHPEDKQEWRRPSLVVLARRAPEEAVLETCKGSGGGGPSPYSCWDGETYCYTYGGS